MPQQYKRSTMRGSTAIKEFVNNTNPDCRIRRVIVEYDSGEIYVIGSQCQTESDKVKWTVDKTSGKPKKSLTDLSLDM